MENNINNNISNNAGSVDNNEKIDKTVKKIVNNKYKQMRGLKAYKDLDDKQLRALAKQKLVSPDHDMEISSLFSDRREITLAKRLLNKYLSDYSPASVSDKNNLRHLIYLEIIQIRLQEKMNLMNSTSNAIPLQMIDSVHKNLREINDLKLKLGLIGEKREEPKNDAYKALELLKDKFKRWREENQGSRRLTCPWCGKMIMLKIRTDAWEAQKHCMFRDRILANKHLIQLYLEQKITKDDVAKILETSTDYVLWLLDRWKTNPDYQKIEAELLESGQTKVSILPMTQTPLVLPIVEEDLESGQVKP